MDLLFFIHFTLLKPHALHLTYHIAISIYLLIFLVTGANVVIRLEPNCRTKEIVFFIVSAKTRIACILRSKDYSYPGLSEKKIVIMFIENSFSLSMPWVWYLILL